MVCASACVCLCENISLAPGGVENTSCKHVQRTSCHSGIYRQFSDRGFLIRERSLANETVRWLTTSSCMYEPMETAQSPGDDTHAVVTRPKGHQCTDCAAVWSFLSVGWQLGPPMGARTRTRAEVNVRPQPLGESSGTKTDRKRKRQTDKETRERERADLVRTAPLWTTTTTHQ